MGNSRVIAGGELCAVCQNKTVQNMKNKISLLFVIFVVSLFIVPQVTFASWWNPGTWKVFNRKSEIKIDQKANTTSNNHATNTTSSKTESSIGVETKKIDTSNQASGNDTAKTNILEKKQENINSGGGALIKPATSGPRPVNPVLSSASSIQTKKAVEEQKISEIQKQIEKTKTQIDQMAAVSAIWWKTASPISTQTYFYQGVEIKIFVLTNDGDYRIEFVNPGNNQKYSRYLKDTQANLEKGELNKKIEQIINDDLGANPAITVIDGFLLSPTIDNLKSFCNTAKTILGTEQKKVLNETRTDFVMKTLTLYEQSQINDLCNFAFGIRKLKSGEYLTASELQSFFQWITYNPSYLLEFNSNDSDTVRGIKIDFNNYWKSLSAYKLIGFPVNSTSNEITTPNAVMEKKINEFVEGGGHLWKIGSRLTILPVYTIPEKILSELRGRLISR